MDSSALRPRTARPPDDDDLPLVRRTRQGDLRAFETLVERHRDVVLRVATRIVGAEDAEDVVQDAFLRAFHRLEGFRGDAPFRAWLLQIVHNSALSTLDRRRRAGREEPTSDEEVLDDVGGERLPDQRLPAERLEDRERADRLQSKLSQLPPAHRVALVLREIEGLSYEEIALVTETPLGSVKGRLHRGRNELIELLRQNTYDWDLPR
jgi:RNA polymerase sigma-70 factor, ECF subfamily